jgi:hypothetical protein
MVVGAVEYADVQLALESGREVSDAGACIS